MICQNCHQPAETGAAFCGNCGAPLPHVENAPPATLPDRPPDPSQAIPGYAMANPAIQKGENRALLSVLLGIAGIIGALFMALAGLVLGLAGVISGTMARSTARRGMSNAGLVLSSMAVLAGLAVWTYNIKHDERFKEQPVSQADKPTAPAISASELSTPCYSVGFGEKLNISNYSDSCDMSAYNGKTISTSTDAYKVYANTTKLTSTSDFMAASKQSLEKDVQTNLPGFQIQEREQGEFADSPAYFITAYDKKNKVALVEAAVLHKTGKGQNVFILVHAINDDGVNLDDMEAQWQWK